LWSRTEQNVSDPTTLSRSDLVLQAPLQGNTAVVGKENKTDRRHEPCTEEEEEVPSVRINVMNPEEEEEAASVPIAVMNPEEAASVPINVMNLEEEEEEEKAAAAAASASVPIDIMIELSGRPI
jgi:hypothetical protein